MLSFLSVLQLLCYALMVVCAMYVFATDIGLDRRKSVLLMAVGFFLPLCVIVWSVPAKAELRLESECVEIAENPKAWILAQGGGSIRPSIVVADVKIAELARKFQDMSDSGARRAVGSAIDALSRERECLAGLKSSAKCE